MRKLPRPLTQEDKDLAGRLYRESFVSIESLALIYQTSHEWMRKMICATVGTRERGSTTHNKKAPFQADLHGPAALILYNQGGYSLHAIAHMLHTQELRMRDWLRDKTTFRRATPRRDHTASQEVNAAIRRGDLTRGPCEWPNCKEQPYLYGKKKRMANTIGHHCDYNYPLVVIWYCEKHHKEWHKHNIPIMKGDTEPRLPQ
jgi:hypothetical protein